MPVDLTAMGMPGCRLYVQPEQAWPFATGNGTALLSWNMPNEPSLAGHHLFSQVFFRQPGVNANGTGTTPGLDSRIEPPATPTNWVTSITQWGITFFFAQPVQAGQFVNGDWFVVGPVTIVDMTPRCTTVGTRIENGAMIDPDASTPDQGYDSAMYTSNAPARYVPAMNVAANLSAANPVVLQPGHSLVKAISYTGTARIVQLRTAAVLTAVAAVPAVESFRPPYAGPDHSVRYDSSMIDWSLLASLPPASGMPLPQGEAASFERVWLDHCPGWLSRFMHPVDNMPDYSRDFTAIYGQGALLCHTAVPQAERHDLLVRLIQIGIDCYGNFMGGAVWEGTGGQGSGRKFPILFAGAMLHDSAMLGIGQYDSHRNPDGSYEAYFGEDSQTFVVERQSPTVINFGFGSYTSADIGLPEYGFSHVNWPNNDRRDWNADPYRQCCTANAWVGEVLVSRIMGLRTAWNHQVLFDYQDRYMAREPAGWERSWMPWVAQMWDLYRPNY